MGAFAMPAIVFRSLKGVQHARAEAVDVRCVARHQSHVVSHRGGGEQAVYRRHGADRADTPPDVSHSRIDRKDTFSVELFQLRQPTLQSFRLPRVARPYGFDSLADLAGRQNADEQIGVADSVEPSGDPRLAPISFAYFR